MQLELEAGLYLLSRLHRLQSLVLVLDKEPSKLKIQDLAWMTRQCTAPMLIKQHKVSFKLAKVLKYVDQLAPFTSSSSYARYDALDYMVDGIDMRQLRRNGDIKGMMKDRQSKSWVCWPVLEKLSILVVATGVFYSPQNRKDIMDMMQQTRPDIRFSLGGNKISSKIAGVLYESLMNNSTLTTLNLGQKLIEDYEFHELSDALKTNSSLNTLDLQNCLIGDIGTHALSKAFKTNATMTSLDLWGNSIGYNEARALSEAVMTNSSLASLYLQNNSIGHNGAQALAEALKTNSTLTTLDLEHNSIGDDGMQALAEALKINCTLTALYLQRNFIGLKGSQVLSEALMLNSTLAFVNFWDNFIGDNGVQALSEDFGE
ncbi:hypothetical protein BGZ81_008747 [Podila clonocystis]|nr:hypothetical protein BGZ81_008747 [Podila clonocystis]